MSVPTSKSRFVRTTKRRDAKHEDNKTIIPHFIQNDESKNSSLHRLFTRITGNPIKNPMNGNMAKNDITSQETATIMPIGTANNIPENIIANIECLFR
jgi:hypothetical protein